MLELNKLYNMDCMDGMREFPDKYFDIAIVDPPYGIGIDGQKECICKKASQNRKYYEFREWDKSIPSEEYFNELFRVSRNQIIWGANYFVKYLDVGTKGWVVWYKGQQGLSMSDCEIAFTSFNSPTRMVTINRVHLSLEGSIHPTQKPIDLYRWLLLNYAKSGDKILDTHVGSASSLIACKEMGFDFIGFELDETYYKAAMERIENHAFLIDLFDS